MRVLLIAALALTALAGCLSNSDTDGNGGNNGNQTFSDLMAGAALWQDPQNTPHPAFGWPTLSSPVNGSMPQYWNPIEARALPESISGLEHLASADGVETGAGIALFGSLAVVPGFGAPTEIIDLSNPLAPVVLSTITPQAGSHRGAAIIAYPDGRLVTVISTSSIIDVWDITDPTDPQPLPVLEPIGGSHKVGVVPGTPIVYNAGSGGGSSSELTDIGHLPGGGTGTTAIFDLTDPTNPLYVQDFSNGYSCHHVFFWNSLEQEKYRAICAGIEFTQIWNTTDPLNPTVIVDVPVHHGVAGTPSASIPIEAFSHYAGLSMDGSILIVGDENGGGGLPPGCGANVGTGVIDPSTPIGAVWFYNVADETNPLLQGWYSANNDPQNKSPGVSCTAHHGRLVPSPDGRDILAQAFYGAGVILIDFSDPTTPVSVGQFVENSDTWEVWYNQGYLFTGDLARGFDVLGFS